MLAFPLFPHLTPFELNMCVGPPLIILQHFPRFLSLQMLKYLQYLFGFKSHKSSFIF